MRNFIYKIITTSDWKKALKKGVFKEDKEFIHFSQQHQIITTMNKKYVGQKNLKLVAINPSKHNVFYKNGYPQMQGEFKVEDVEWVRDIEHF